MRYSGLQKAQSKFWVKIPPSLALLAVAVFAFLLVLAGWYGVREIGDFYSRYHRYDAIILEAAKRNDVDPRLVKAVIWRESRFRADALGKSGEVGLMQIMPDQAAIDWRRAKKIDSLSNGALSDPVLNIEIGAWYLGDALRKWKGQGYKEYLQLALCQYNAGGKYAEKWKPSTPDGTVIDKIEFASTISYVNSVIKKYESYQKDWDITKEEKK